MADLKSGPDDLLFADEERLRHEIKFLRERVTSLEVFKKLFFTLQEDLVAERNKTTELQRQVKGLVPEKASAISAVPKLDDAALAVPAVVEEQIHQLESDLHNTQDMASVAMTTMGEYGLVIDFFKESTSAASYQDLVMLLFMALSGYGLEATVEIRSVHGDLIFTQNDGMKDHDIALINRFKLQGKIVDYEGMVFVNFTHISLLARNFPDDKEKAGRVKDYLTTLCYGVNGRVDAIDANSRLKKERQNLYRIVTSASKAMANIERSMGEHIRKTDDVYKLVVQKMTEAFAKLGLPEKQQALLVSLLNTGNKQLSVVLVDSLSLDEKFVAVLNKLEQTYAGQAQAEQATGTAASVPAEKSVQE